MGNTPSGEENKTISIIEVGKKLSCEVSKKWAFQLDNSKEVVHASIQSVRYFMVTFNSGAKSAHVAEIRLQFDSDWPNDVKQRSDLIYLLINLLILESLGRQNLASNQKIEDTSLRCRKKFELKKI